MTEPLLTAPLLTAQGLIKKFGRVVALDGCDFDLYPGEILGVIGDNGAGKSTLIKAISGAMSVDAGEIRLEGQLVSYRSPIEARMAGIETVYQTLALSPALSIADNMFLGRELRKPGVIGSVFRMLDHKEMEKARPATSFPSSASSPSRISARRWRRSPADSGRASRWRGPPPSGPKSSSWTNRPRPWA